MLSIVNDHNYQIDWLRKDLLKVFRLTKIKVLKPEQKNISVGLLFSDKEEIWQLNKKYRNKDFPTDVLSFHADPEMDNNYLGDIVICYQICQDQSIKYEHSLRREISFLFLHGLLHLIGYDHEEKEEEKLMFSLQDEILNELNIKR